MNLAEFPITLITDRAPKGQSTLYFESKQGRLVIKGSEADGLPTASDADVIVALIYLTKLRNNFTDPTVNFSRYELLKLLNWSNEGKNYRRLNVSFDRWHGVALHFEKCWWDNKTNRYVDAKIHIIESVIIADKTESAHHKNTGLLQLPLSSFTWNKKFFESCQADNLKRLDLHTYFSLKHPSSKRLFRFLDKRFYNRGDITFDLNEIALERVGLSRNYSDAGKLKEKLQPAIDELVEIGFLYPLKRDERYVKTGLGRWTVRFSKHAPSEEQLPPQTLADTPVLLPMNEASELKSPTAPTALPKLVELGVTKTKAENLVTRFAAESIESKIDVLEWLLSKKDKRVEKSPAGYLVKSIEDDYAVPKGFISRAEREKRERERAEQKQREAEAERQKRENEARERAERSAIAMYWKSLTPDAQTAFDEAALAEAAPEELDGLFGPLARMAVQERRQSRIRRILQQEGRLPATN
jgi:plasmid replication initiation protein